MGGEQGLAEAGAVAQAAGREGGEFGVDRRLIAPGELFRETQAPPKLREDRPVGPGLPWSRAEGLAEGGAAQSSPSHPPSRFTGRRAEPVEPRLPFRCRRRSPCEHHQRAAGHRGVHPIQQRQAHGRVGGHHAPKIQAVPLHRFDLLPHGEAHGIGLAHHQAASWHSDASSMPHRSLNVSGVKSLYRASSGAKPSVWAATKTAAIPPSARSRRPRLHGRAKPPAGARAGAAGALRRRGRRGSSQRCGEERVGSDAYGFGGLCFTPHQGQDPPGERKPRPTG